MSRDILRQILTIIGIALKHPDVTLVAAGAGVAAAIVALLAVVSALPRGPLPLRR